MSTCFTSKISIETVKRRAQVDVGGMFFCNNEAHQNLNPCCMLDQTTPFKLTSITFIFCRQNRLILMQPASIKRLIGNEHG